MSFEVVAGTIYSAFFPFSDLSAKRKRPVLALDGIDEYGDVRVAFITRTPVTEPKGLPLSTEYFAGPPLPFPSHLRLDKTFSLHASRLEKPVARLSREGHEKILRQLITLDIPQFVEARRGSHPHFVPGSSAIPVSGKVIGAAEITNMTQAALDAWLTTGRFNAEFERRLGEFLGAAYVLTTNSGSSANLLAFSALTSPQLGERALKPGDEVITVAAGFPTTVNPILQHGCVPVFVDIQIPTYNIDVAQIEAAISPRTRAIMLAHTLGNPFDLAAVTRIARQHHLWLIEDCCDALGSRYDGQLVGSFGDIGTLSFYPAHHITMGEGGAVFTNNPDLKRIVESMRDWGRDCWCQPGSDNTCGKRFGWQLGDLPHGYDHKYVYSHLGYNLKITDMQAACALAQLDRLPGFIAARRRNFDYLTECLAPLSEFLVLPQATPGSEPSWFGFPITIKPAAGINRVDLLKYLDQHKIGTRLLFAGNLLHQPYMKGRNCRVANSLANTDRAMRETFWMGVWPGLSDSMLDYMADRLQSYFGLDI